ncbi:ABC transporter permease [Parabacteroides sp. AF18-52]|uniref:ABC transporter permease n=2 Tax=Parabacteroides TaxID=375288 RepID=UPI000EFDFBD9|nr:ABC transporter permease [Parabacteroides sp. AF18-52]RHR40950.1 ABC transporter permease [Parabacteroides sp. AF18-52]
MNRLDAVLVFRNFKKNKLSTVTMIFSIIVGIFTFIVLSSYIGYERSYDKYVNNHENIYRIYTEFCSLNGQVLTKPKSERGIGEILKEKHPEVKNSGFVGKLSSSNFRIDDDIFSEEYSFYASNSILDILNVTVLHNDDHSKLLNEPYKVLLSESFAHNFFGNDDPRGKMIFMYPAFNVEIQGVYKDFPKQAHFRPQMLFSFDKNMRLPPPVLDKWGAAEFYTYLELNDGTDIKKIEDNMNQLVSSEKRHYFESTGTVHKYHLQPLTEIHTKSHLSEELSENIQNSYLNILLAISVLIVILAGFNYVYFAYTRMAKNSLKLGLQKLLGADKQNILVSFVLESFIIHVVALACSIILVILMKGYLLNNLGFSLSFSLANHSFWIGFTMVFLISIFLNGFIPFYTLSRNNCLRLINNNSKSTLRMYLTVVQFVTLIAIIGVIIGIDTQIKYLINKDKGYDIDHVIAIAVPKNISRESRLVKNLNAFDNDLMNYPGIEMLTSTNIIPGDLPPYNYSFTEVGKSSGGKAGIIIADSSLLSNYNIKLLAGRNFTDNKRTDNFPCMINMKTLKNLGYEKPEEAVGRLLSLDEESGMISYTTEIVGVCSDFDFVSMFETPHSLILVNWTNMLWGYYVIKVNENYNKADVISYVKERYNATFDNFPFQYYYVDDYFNQQFKDEIHLNLILKHFVILACIIAFINLLSVTWFSTSSRSKEIGIRKVFGAAISEVVVLLNVSIVKWIALSFLIAIPIIWVALGEWLKSFAYRINMDPMILLLPGVAALVISFITISFITYSLAKKDPVESIHIK